MKPLKDIQNRMSLFVWSLMAAGFASRPAPAATVMADFGVTASVQASCLISAVTRKLSPTAQPAASPASMVTITCSHSTQYSLDFSEGTSGDAAGFCA